MITLVITDIPRIAALFERLPVPGDQPVVVGEIHRGIEELERLKPELIIIQNHLSGLSADILLKHLRSRLGRRKARFALISPAEHLDPELTARFAAILDPTLADEHLEQAVTALLLAPAPAPSDNGQPPSVIPALQQPSLPEGAPPQIQAPPETVDGPPRATVAPSIPPGLAGLNSPTDETVPAPGTYERPGRPNRAIISAFSRHLDHTAEELRPQPARLPAEEEAPDIRELQQEPPFPAPVSGQGRSLRRPALWLSLAMVALVVAITWIQQRPRPVPPVTIERPPPATVPAGVRQPPTTTAAAGPGPFPSHGSGRPKALPSFIPRSGLDPAYGKENPGWARYQGVANEFRVFRGKDGAIQALQVIDRSGAGIQDSFYAAVLKELAGATTMRATSSLIKEGYEIRRGMVGGLDLVQYRDAQGGRLRGFVVSWP